jgi:acyl-CoA hydrolase
MNNTKNFQKIKERTREKWPNKFSTEEKIFSHIRRGDRLFIGTGCGQPQYLIRALREHVKNHPKAFFDTEVLQVWTLGIAPYLETAFKHNFRLNSFFIGNDIRDLVNKGAVDYTPVFLSQVPEMFRRKVIPIDVALVQTSLPDKHGHLSLGINVEIVKAAVESADMIIVQINANMPRIYGQTFIHLDDVDFAVFHDEPLLEYLAESVDEVSKKIGRNVAHLINDGDTIQVGYGRLRNGILSQLGDKKHLGVHTEILSDGFVDLMKRGVVDNSRKTVDRGKTVASFCMGRESTYTYLHENPKIEFRSADYTNDPLTLSKLRNLCAINMVLQIDLTGQATSESMGTTHYSGIGGQADFMRGVMLAPGGKSILVLKSTTKSGSVSRIVPMLTEGSGVTLTRGDINYVVTEYGIAYLHGKNLRERSMSLIAIAHPEFRSWLVKEAKRLRYIYQDQEFIPGKAGEYPEHLETYRTTRKGLNIFLRPVRISDEPLLKDFFYALSDKSMYRRFFSARLDMHHEALQKFVVIDYTGEMGILAVIDGSGGEMVIGYGQYIIDPDTHTAEISFAVRDAFHRKGVAWEIVSYLTILAKQQGLTGLTASVLESNGPALALMDKIAGEVRKTFKDGAYDFHVSFGHAML